MAPMNLWKRKLLALLHDPPEKPYDFSLVHDARAEAHAAAFGFSQQHWKAYRDSDWSAAAADRFVFPKAATGERSLDAGVAFTHPLAGAPALSADDYPSQQDACSIIGSVRPTFDPAASEQDRFWLAWRLWMEYVAGHAEGQTKKAYHLPYLPADTRIPDGSIWHHNAVVSALEATRGEDGVRRPAFLLFHLGPVQEFIAQARSTRDLWSGSYLLSWLMAHAMQAVAEVLGPDCLIFPSLRGQPLFDWLNRERLQKAKYPGSQSYWDAIQGKTPRAFEELVLTPNLPNRFLAVVPQGFGAAGVEKALRREWQTIAEASRGWLKGKGCPVPVRHLDRFDAQIAEFWQVSWQLWPWQPTKQALEAFGRIPMSGDSSLRLAYDIAHGIRAEHKDSRCYRDSELDAGWAWNAHYQLCSHRFDARRQTRDFTAWNGSDRVRKDDYSGKEEEVLDEDWRKKAGRHPELGHLFRKTGEHLGAVNLVKRVWHKAYLEQEMGLKRARESFDSVPAIAAAPFAAAVFQRTEAPGRPREALTAYMQKAADAATLFPDTIAPCETSEARWFERTDASVFFQHEWEKLARPRKDDGLTNEDRAKAKAAGKALRDLTEALKFKPSAYYAVLALDGDEIGKWLSGERTPAVEKVITPAAARYFKNNVAGGKEWLEKPRPISPSYHLQFSEALSNFGLYCARRIVEHHHGQLIYAGGDDVLAMLPAEEAISCAQGLRQAFQGAGELEQKYPSVFRFSFSGAVRLAEESRGPSEPSWPLLVPGPTATVSVGIAMGHIKEPLQDMIQAAQAAEQRAKNAYGRNALAVTIFKRSGEQIEWGTKFMAEPFHLLDFLNNGQTYKAPLDDPKRKMPISGKFPYRICGLLRAYDPLPDPMKPRRAAPLTPELQAIAEKDLQWAVSQLGNADVFAELYERSVAWLHAVRETGRPLEDFYNLFAVEAFIARQGE
jgi:CRISPR-associated protein Cmr2